jgi:hypothetical protein
MALVAALYTTIAIKKSYIKKSEVQSKKYILILHFTTKQFCQNFEIKLPLVHVKNNKKTFFFLSCKKKFFWGE